MLRLWSMKKPPSSCAECGENKSILTQVSSTIEIIYLCSDCYKDKYSEEVQNQIENKYEEII